MRGKLKKLDPDWWKAISDEDVCLAIRPIC
jgi:hypothetical protein